MISIHGDCITWTIMGIVFVRELFRSTKFRHEINRFAKRSTHTFDIFGKYSTDGRHIRQRVTEDSTKSRQRFDEVLPSTHIRKLIDNCSTWSTNIWHIRQRLNTYSPNARQRVANTGHIFYMFDKGSMTIRQSFGTLDTDTRSVDIILRDGIVLCFFTLVSSRRSSRFLSSNYYVSCSSNMAIGRIWQYENPPRGCGSESPPTLGVLKDY